MPGPRRRESSQRGESRPERAESEDPGKAAGNTSGSRRLAQDEEQRQISKRQVSRGL